MQESRKASCASIASVCLFPFCTWWDWGFSAGCSGKVSLEATGTVSRGSLVAGLWRCSEGVCTAVELPRCCPASQSLETGTLIGIPAALVGRNNGTGARSLLETGPRIQQNSYSVHLRQELLKYISEGFKCWRTHPAQPGQISQFCASTTHKESKLLQTQTQEKSTLGNKEGMPSSAHVLTTGWPHCGTPMWLLGGMCVSSSNGFPVYKGETQ